MKAILSSYLHVSYSQVYLTFSLVRRLEPIYFCAAFSSAAHSLWPASFIRSYFAIETGRPMKRKPTCATGFGTEAFSAILRPYALFRHKVQACPSEEAVDARGSSLTLRLSYQSHFSLD